MAALAIPSLQLITENKFSGTATRYTPEFFIDRIKCTVGQQFGSRPIPGALAAGVVPNQAAIDEWDERFGYCVGTNIIGAAETWYHTLGDAIKFDYVALRAAFIARFNTQQNQIRNRATVKTLTRGKEEAVTDFAVRIGNLVEQAFPDLQQVVREEHKRKYFPKDLYRKTSDQQ